MTYGPRHPSGSGGPNGHEKRASATKTRVSCDEPRQHRADGCMIPTMERDKRYGRLRVIGAAKSAGAASGHKYYLCQCDCGKTLEVRGTHLRQGRTTSCGCSRIGARTGIER